jgi:hypothetical protein
MAVLADIARDWLAGTAAHIEHWPTWRDERAKTIQPSAFVKAAFPQSGVDPGVGVPLIDFDNAFGIGAGVHGKKLRRAGRLRNGCF